MRAEEEGRRERETKRGSQLCNIWRAEQATKTDQQNVDTLEDYCRH